MPGKKKKILAKNWSKIVYEESKKPIKNYKWTYLNDY